MVFTSLAFIVFAIILFFTYYLVPKKGQWIVLAVGSGVFYFWAGWKYFLFLLGTIILTYLIGLWLGFLNERMSTKLNSSEPELADSIKKKYAAYKRTVCIFGVIVCAGVLFFLKYFNFFGSVLYPLFSGGKNYNPLDLIVPVGISFYTFSTIGYIIDVYRGSKPEKNPFKYSLFVSFFPIVLQGPICSFSEISEQLFSGHDLDINNVKDGARRVILGFFKKIVIADLIAIIVNSLFSNYAEYHGFVMFLAMVFYVIQLYADFSGFMDISIGYSKMLGITLPENFDMPLVCSSLPLFWRKWHITLGRWFKKYIYIPLGGNRVPKWRWAINIMVVWLLTGLWHGASWNFIIWGIFNGVLIVISGLVANSLNSFKGRHQKVFGSKPYLLFQIIKTFYLVCVGFLFFRTSTLQQFGVMFVESLKFWDWGDILTNDFANLGGAWWVYLVLLVAILICYFCNSLFAQSDNPYLPKFNLQSRLHKSIQYIFLLVIVVSTLAVFFYQLSLDQTGGSFIYFDF